MKLLIISLVILSALLTVKCCGEEGVDTIKRFPFMASLKYDGNHTCSAVILTKYLAVTAANCLYGKHWTKFSISVGKTYLVDGPGHHVFGVDVHRLYHPAKKDYDVGVVAFEKVTFNETVKPLKWGKKLSHPSMSVVTAGWGLECNNTEEETNPLQTAEGTVINMGKCKKYYKGVRRLSATRMFCTEANNNELCVAESGSPLLTTKGLEGLGIASIYDQCPQPDRPMVFMNINSVSIKLFLKDMIRKYKDFSTLKATTKEHEDTTLSSKPSEEENEVD